MRRLSIGQLNRASEILGNIAVAWFSAGAISPLLAAPRNLWNFVFTFGTSILMAVLFTVFSLTLVKGVKS